MQKVKVKISDLKEKLKTNREGHRALFLKAQEGYRQTVIELLEKTLEEARNHKRIDMRFHLPAPVDQTKDYDRVLAMLEMSVDDEIEITQHEFANYVMDDWAWKDQFMASNQLYLAKMDSGQ